MNAPQPPLVPALQRPRRVERIVTGQLTSDGAGVRLTRLLAAGLQRRLDPWLMFDAFGSDKPGEYIGGFPDHPHRGFETLTYMLAGRLRHRDSQGGAGLLEAGGVQWMVAGRGVIHSELPEQTAGLMAGFQLWLNLPAADKLCEPCYRDIPAAALPQATAPGGVTVRVIAGHSHGVDGAIQRPHTEPLYLDLHLPAGARFAQPLPPGHNAFLYVYQGQAVVGPDEEALGEKRMAILANEADSDGLSLAAVSETRLIVVAGRPLGEPIAQYGPFVMNTPEQIRQTLEDYRAGRIG